MATTALVGVLALTGIPAVRADGEADQNGAAAAGKEEPGILAISADPPLFRPVVAPKRIGMASPHRVLAEPPVPIRCRRSS